MSTKYAAGVITAVNPVTPSGPYQTSTASGIWTMEQAGYWIKQGQWPTAGNVKNFGGLWSWGRGLVGALGLGNTTSYSSPKQVGSLTTWLDIAGGTYTGIATKTDGTLWSWGQNDLGQLGLGNLTYYSSPKQIGALTNWSKVSIGPFRQVSAIKTDGTLWSWGSKNAGALGLGNLTYYSSPKQVGSLTNWLNISCGRYSFTLATKTDGTLWAWGYNLQGQLGLGNRTNYSSPKQVGALTTWSNISGGYNCSLATKTDGTLWSWGNNTYGQLGLGNTTNYSSPKQVGALTNWSKVTAGSYVSFAIKTDGTLWYWGSNGYGQLGLGNTTNYSSPKQVGALTNWSKIACGNVFVSATKTDGTSWTWGDNTYGQLGLGNRTNYSSPKQVGSLTTWINNACLNDGCFFTQ